MKKFSITYYDELGNEETVDYMVDSEVLEYLEALEMDSAVLMGTVVKMSQDIEQLRNVVEAYRILCGEGEKLN